METHFNPYPSDQTSTKTQDSWLAVAGGAVIAFGSLMPFVTFSPPYAVITPGAKGASVFFGLIVVALGFALRVASRPGRLIVSIVTLGLSALAVLGYVGFIVIGHNGWQEQDPFGDPVTVTFTPAIGLYLAIVGSAVAAVAAIRSFIHWSAR